ncbi:MAG: hypothetical protein IJW34_09645 [Clostridia bacterium]|nr:hypothetical protein [Clostridia bacterium]
MKKFSWKKALLMSTSLVLTAVLAIGGTLAYLQDEDSDVNVMTLGNVKIEQIEQERDANGNLVDFTQNKPAYPAVGPIEWATKGVDVNGTEYKVFTDDLKNVVDKIITVKNTGKSPAYVRTIVAIEAPGFDPNDLIHINWNGTDVTISAPVNVTKDGVDYVVFTFTYKEALAPNTISAPSLVQVFLDSATTNEDCEAFGDTWEIIAISQAVQVDGFDNAAAAFEAAFPVGENNANVASWLGAALAENSVDTWDGTSDTSWYDPADPKTAYELTTAEQLAGLAELVSGDTTFDGVTFTLAKDLDLYCEDTSATADGDPVSFRPIGDHSKNGTFEGTFDGNGKTISNLYQNGWDLGYDWDHYGSYGLFGNLNDATVKNLTITGAESYIEGGDVGGITGSATGTCVFENITIEDSVFATYNNGNGGIIGWSGAGNYTFKNVTLAEDTVLAGLWGSFDSSIGGIVGQGEPGATYNFENVDIACRLDVYNDCTASYDYYIYRMCGMLIGRLKETTTIDGANYPDTSKYNITCTDVTVTYGEWADYHYCRAANARGKRVEAGYSYDGIAADYDHSVCTVHHLEVIPFDQIFGGDQYAVKGLKEYTGVTVVYNNDKQ